MPLFATNGAGTRRNEAPDSLTIFVTSVIMSNIPIANPEGWKFNSKLYTSSDLTGT
jgi:hypothetical protein